MSQDPMQLLIFLAIGLAAGWLAGLVMGGGGLLRNLVAGVIGVFVGGYVMRLANINLPIDNPYLSQIITGAIGAVIVIVVARIVAK